MWAAEKIDRMVADAVRVLPVTLPAVGRAVVAPVENGCGPSRKQGSDGKEGGSDGMHCGWLGLPKCLNGEVT
jgi:hypothetical protein